MKRREYEIDIEVNYIRLKKVIIDAHFELKHSSSISDDLILQLVKQLDGEVVEPDKEDPPFTYYKTDRMKLNGKFYKLIWLLEDDELYIGVINAYRR